MSLFSTLPLFAYDVPLNKLLYSTHDAIPAYAGFSAMSCTDGNFLGADLRDGKGISKLTSRLVRKVSYTYLGGRHLRQSSACCEDRGQETGHFLTYSIAIKPLPLLADGNIINIEFQQHIPQVYRKALNAKSNGLISLNHFHQI